MWRIGVKDFPLFRCLFVLAPAICYVFILGLVLFGGWALNGCGTSKAATGLRAVEIQSPVGVVCYAILDEAERAVGGSCLYQK